MLKVWDSANFRRTVAALSLIAAPVLFGVVEQLYPPEAGDPTTMLSNIARYHDRQFWGVMLGLLSMLLFIPATFGLIHLLSRKSTTLGHIGGGLTLVGVFLLTILHTFNLVLWEMANPGLNQSAMQALLLDMGQRPWMPVLFFGHDIFAIGLIVLAVGVWRAKVGPRFAGPSIILGVILDIVLSTIFGDSLAIGVLTSALLVIGLGSIGLSLLGSSDAAWEQMLEPEAALS